MVFGIVIGIVFGIVISAIRLLDLGSRNVVRDCTRYGKAAGTYICISVFICQSRRLSSKVSILYRVDFHITSCISP